MFRIPWFHHELLGTTSSMFRMSWFYDIVKMCHSDDWSDFIIQDDGGQPEVCTYVLYVHALGPCRILSARFFVRGACYLLQQTTGYEHYHTG